MTMEIRTYDEDFVARVKDLAVIGLYPVQIAERLGLQGRQRLEFLMDICSKKHPLHEEFLISRANRDGDMDAALTEMAAAGDIDALELDAKIRWRQGVENIKTELFDV